MDLSRAAAAILTLLGLGLIVTGVCLVYLPAGLVIAGVGIGSIGLFVVNVDGEVS
jgi:hypothetical protein